MPNFVHVSVREQLWGPCYNEVNYLKYNDLVMPCWRQTRKKLDFMDAVRVESMAELRDLVE